MNGFWNSPQHRPDLDPDFLPAILCWQQWTSLCQSISSPLTLKLALVRSPESVTTFTIPLVPDHHPAAQWNFRVAERILKFLLWSRGGHQVALRGPDSVTHPLKHHFSHHPCGIFDQNMMGDRIYLSPFTITASDQEFHDIETSRPLGRHLHGCRIGFDLGASDRKVAAVQDGKPLFSEEFIWDPLPQSDPDWHFNQITDVLKRAAAHLPRVDAIGGSSAGVYVDNEVRVASLFRGIPPDKFDSHIRNIFHRLRAAWGGIPFEVVNDGEVTALAGSMALGKNAVLGMAMGSSLAVGYVNPSGQIQPWLNELAFSPIDWQVHAHRDEWSGDLGCGVQYFSQQAVGRLLQPAGIPLNPELKLPEKLVEVQKLMQLGDERAASIYRTIGTYLGYAIPFYKLFYQFDHLLVLGRVLSGTGGEIILQTARNIMNLHFPDISKSVAYHIPDETEKRHGQAIAAASLPQFP